VINEKLIKEGYNLRIFTNYWKINWGQVCWWVDEEKDE